MSSPEPPDAIAACADDVGAADSGARAQAERRTSAMKGFIASLMPRQRMWFVPP
jgi:hypothetical protein